MGNKASAEKSLTGGFLHAFEGNVAELRAVLDADEDAVKASDKHGRTMFYWAASNGMIDACRLLADRGASVTVIESQEGSNPLHNAVHAGHVETVVFLIEKGVPVTLADHERRTALHFAAHEGDVEMGNLLLACPNIEVDARDSEGRTPLHWSVFNGLHKFVRILLKAGADPNAEDDSGRTPVIYSAHIGHHKCLKSLLENGGDPEHTDEQGLRPIDHAIHNEQKKCIDVLKKLGIHESRKKLLQEEVTVWRALKDMHFDNVLYSEDGGWDDSVDLTAMTKEDEDHLVHQLKSEVAVLKVERAELLAELGRTAHALEEAERRAAEGEGAAPATPGPSSAPPVAVVVGQAAAGEASGGGGGGGGGDAAALAEMTAKYEASQRQLGELRMVHSITQSEYDDMQERCTSLEHEVAVLKEELDAKDGAA